MMKFLTGDTMMPLSLSVAIIGSGSFWLSGVSAKVETHDKLIMETKLKQEKTADDLSQIRVDIGVIKQLLINRERKNGN